LTKTYRDRRVVNGVSLVVRRGEAVGLLGPNGAGKTTCFYMITGLVPVDEGSIEINGNDVTTMPMYRRARLGVGYLPQEASIFRGLTVEENIRAVLEVHDKDKAKRERKLDSLLAEFSISHPEIAGRCAVRRRTPPPRNRPRACHRPDLHAARRTLCRRRPDFGRPISRRWCATSPPAASAFSSPTTMCAKRSASSTGPISSMPAKC
jgi:hypothetical protein